MDKLTYQQVLADLYDDTAKNVLVDEREYETEDIPAHDKTKPQTYEVENPEDFQKEHGSRQAVEVPKTVPKYTDITTQSVRYNKDVKTQVLSIDSRFRNLQADVTSNFLFRLNVPVKNVVSVRLSSIEVPNTWYNFSKVKGNIYMRVSYNGDIQDITTKNNVNQSRVGIQNGNYVIDVIDPSQTSDVNLTPQNGYPNNLIYVLNEALHTLTVIPSKKIRIGIDQISSKVVIYHSDIKEASPNIDPDSAPAFEIDFTANGPFIDRDADWGLGYNLGFRQKYYTGKGYYIAEALPDTIGPNYLFLSLSPDWKVVTHNSTDKQNTGPFAKIVITVPKNDVIYDSGSNTVTKEYWLQQPQNVQNFQVVLTDAYEEIIDLQGAHMSLTLELKEVMNPALYEHIRSVLPDQQQEFGAGT
jgi:hypothetical protein